MPQQVLTAVFKFLKITDVNVASCANDAGNAGVYLKDFAEGYNPIANIPHFCAQNLQQHALKDE